VTATGTGARAAAARPRAWQRPGRPPAWLGVSLLATLSLLVVLPLARLVLATFSQGTSVWEQVLAGEIAENLLWRPLGASLVVGLATAVLATALGATLAGLVVLTDLPGRRVIGVLATLPFIIPSFAIALAWDVVFRNERIGGHVGLVHGLGLPVPDWLAWGIVPVTAVLVIHYSSLAFGLVAAALASVNADLLEAAEVAGAGRARVLRGIAFPLAIPALSAAALLVFAEAVSNFAVPALLGLPVRFHTLSTRLVGAIETGQTERGFALSVILIAVAAVLLWAGTRATSRRSFATIGGRGERRKRLLLGGWRWPAFVLALAAGIVTTVVPGAALLLGSLYERPGSLDRGLTWHYWIGAADAAIAQGQPGILRSDQFASASLTTVALGLAVAAAASVLGLLIGYLVSRDAGSRLATLVGQLSLMPIIIPGIALGAAFIALFARPLGPVPALYGTFGLLVIAGAAATLPFAAQSGRAAATQVATELEEAATVSGARFPRRLGAIFLPLVSRGLVAGAVLVFVKMVRDLGLVILLVVPTTPLLSVVAFRYASENFVQFANAVTVVIVLVSVVATLVAQRVQRAAQPWSAR